MDATRLLQGFLAGILIASVTAPVGVSGAVFLLPVQLSWLHVPNPAVTPTNLIYNVVSGPGALVRYFRRIDAETLRLTRRLLIGTLPGVVIGAALRVYVVPGPDVFRVVAAAVLLPIGCWLVLLAVRQGRPRHRVPDGAVTPLAVVVGVVGGVYGIGGGSIIGPILVGGGLSVVVVAPAALASTFITSIVGAVAYVALSRWSAGSIAPEWPVGIACGLGGLVGGYIGAWWQPHLPERALRMLLGTLAIGVGAAYLVQGLT